MPKNSKSKLAAIARYKVRIYETVSAQAQRSERINEQISIGARRAGASKSAYILDAIRARLQRDGVSAADLPPEADKPEA